MWQVLLTSEAFGEDTFEYDSLEEAEAGFQRLKESCLTQQKIDQIERELNLIQVLKTWTTSEEEED